MSAESYPSIEDTAIFLGRQGKQLTEGSQMYSVGFQSYTRPLARAVVASGWTHGGAAFTVEDGTGYVATNLGPEAVNALPGSTDSMELATSGELSGRYITFTDTSVVKEPRIAKSASQIIGGGIGGVTLGFEAVASHLTETNAIFALLAGVGGAAVAGSTRYINKRQQAARYTDAYRRLKQEIKDEGQSYNASHIILSLADRHSIANDTVNDITYGLWPNKEGSPLGQGHINVFGTVSGLMQAAGKNAPDLWVNKLQPIAGAASTTADRFELADAELTKERDFNAELGDRESKRGNELSEKKEAELTQLVGHMAAFSAINLTIRFERRKELLEANIQNLALVSPLSKTRPFANDLESIYRMLFSGLLQLDPGEESSTTTMTAILRDYERLSNGVSHASHIDRMYDYFMRNYPALYGEQVEKKII